MKMGKSTAGFVLGLIGGILGILAGIGIAIGGGALAALNPLAGYLGATASLAFGIWYISSGILVIIFSLWMKNPKKCRMGGILTLIFSVVGSGGLLGLIGGILGIVAGGKKK